MPCRMQLRMAMLNISYAKTTDAQVTRCEVKKGNVTDDFGTKHDVEESG